MQRHACYQPALSVAASIVHVQVLRCGQLMHDEAVTALHVQEGLLFELAMQEKRRAAKSPRSGENVLSLEVMLGTVKPAAKAPALYPCL